MKTIYPFMGLALCGIAAQAQEKPNFLIIQCDHLTPVSYTHLDVYKRQATYSPHSRLSLRSRTL